MDVEAPTGETFAIDDPALIRILGVGVSGAPGADIGAFGSRDD